MAVVPGKTYRIKSHAGTGMCLRLASGTQTVAAHKLLQTGVENTTNMGQRWQLSVVSSKWNIVSAINNTYALNFNTAKTDRKAEIYPYSNSDANTSIDLVIVNSDEKIYKIRITIDGTMYYLTAGSKTSTAYATWETASGDDDQKWQFVEVKNYATYPCAVMNITQTYSGTYSHQPYSTGTPYDYPTDEACEDEGRSYMYCPCDEMEVLKVYTTGSANTIWLKSTEKVVMPCGEDYLVMMVIHPETDDLSEISVGDTFTRGQQMFREGMSGAEANHFHISVGTGDGCTGNGWTPNSNGKYVLTPVGDVIKIEEAFYLDKSFTTVYNDAGINFIDKP